VPHETGGKIEKGKKKKKKKKKKIIWPRARGSTKKNIDSVLGCSVRQQIPG